MDNNCKSDDPGYNFDLGDEFQFNQFLVELAREISAEELKYLKNYHWGCIGFGKKILENITNAMEYFNFLRERNLLSMDNICNIQAIIWHLNRKDLYQKLVDFGRRQENRTLYFHTPKNTPEEGYKYVHFHVEGQVSRENVEKIRLQIAFNLCVPPNFVIVAGIEKSNSIIITMMVPEQCGMTLSSLTDKEKLTLEYLSIDYFIMDDIKYSVEVIPIHDEELKKMLYEAERGKPKYNLQPVKIDELEKQKLLVIVSE